jgi:hypothetical protein
MHLATHLTECFLKFSLNFVKGAGEIEGEILETLWPDMDAWSATVYIPEDVAESGQELRENFAFLCPDIYSPQKKV